MDAQPEKHIFISYSRNDGEPYVTELENRLGAHHRVWRDKRDLRPDQDFTADIERGIEAASHVVVCLTPDTKRDNSFVRREIQYALAIKRPVIPVRCADIPPQVAIINNEWVDYFRDADAAVARLLEIVSNTDYANKPSGNTADPFREYLEFALKFIVDGLDQRIIRLIDLKAAPNPDAVNFTPPPERASIFKQAFSGVKKTEPEKPPQNFDTFQEGFKLYNERALLLGQPGAGKTITLMAYARDAYAARLADPTQPLPLFGLVATWNPRIKPPLSDWLAESLNLDLKLLRAEIDGGRALLLLDGLDELRAVEETPPPAPPLARGGESGEGSKTDPRRDFLDALPANNRILLACRIEDYGEIGQKANLNGAITLRDLTTEQVQTYLADQPHLLRLIESDDQLRELTQTPLLLSIFAFAYQDMTDTEREQLTAIDSAGELRDKIFMRYIDQRYEHEAAKVGAEMPLTLEELKEALGKLAMGNAAGQGWWDGQGERHGISPNLIDREWIETEKIIANAAVVLPLADRLRLMAHEEEKTYRFVHLLLRDALAFAHALSALSDTDADVRSNATFALGKIGDTRAVPPLIKCLDDLDSMVRRSAAEALGIIGDTHAVEPLIAGLHDPDEAVRYSASDALANYTNMGEAAVEPLIIALSDPDEIIRAHAADTLGGIMDERAVEPLITALRDTNADVRRSAADALGNFFTERATEALIMALRDTNADVRHTAAGGLGWIYDAHSVEQIITALDDPDEKVRRQVAHTLLHIGTTQALAAVEAFKRDEIKTQKAVPAQQQKKWWQFWRRY